MSQMAELPSDSLAGSGTPATLADWLARCERLHPQGIALGLERVHDVLSRLDVRFDAVVVVVAGTNGKGSTCAMLEAIALQAGYRVGLYTSPHLVQFTERCRIDGRRVEEGDLLPHFAAVEAARQGVALTYFEFTTLAILRLLAQQPLDLVVLEVGLGGRLDAVNVIDGDCAIITSIDLDHMEYLGPDRESIGREKAGIMRPGRPVIVSDPLPPAGVLRCAEELGAQLWLSGRDFRFEGDRQQWNWSGRARRHHGLAYPALRGANQLLNAAGVLAAFEALHLRLPVPVQAIRSGLAVVEVPGRFQIIPGQPTLVLDVAHNPHAVAALVQNLDQMGFYPRTHAVFGAMADKDLATMMRRAAPLVDAWYFTDLEGSRPASAQALAAIWQAVAAEMRSDALGRAPAPPLDCPWTCHASPTEALAAAVSAADPTDRILVFGSFLTVGGVLRQGIPRLSAPHLDAAGSRAAP